MAAMINDSPSQRARPAASFHGYPSGDTQPNPSQVYHDFRTSIAITSMAVPNNMTESINTDRGDAGDTDPAENTMRTAKEGDSNYIDLVKVLSPDTRTPTSDDLFTSPQTEMSLVGAITPAPARRKRPNGEDVQGSDTRVTKTPRLSQFFGAAQTPVIGTTQLFNLTQAPSSPAPDGTRSDPILTRPSPNMYANAILTSPVMTFSSPPVAMKPLPTAGEPRNRYTSTRESQERRAALESNVPRDYATGEGTFDGADEEDDDLERRRHKRMRLKLWNDQAKSECGTVFAPSRQSSRPSSSRTSNSSTKNLTTLGTVQQVPRVQFAVLHDTGKAKDETPPDQGDEDQEKTVEDRIVDVDDGQSLADDDGHDVFDELSQDVFRSEGNAHESDDEPSLHADAEPYGEHVVQEQDDNDGDHEDDDGDAVRASDATDFHSVQPSQPTAIADSQSEHRSGKRSLLSAPKDQPSSMTSMIPGSQFAGRTSQELAQQSSRVPASLESPRRIPYLSAEEQAKRGVSSSPPLPSADNTYSEERTKTSLMRRDVLPSRQESEDARALQPRHQDEIPESDLLETEGTIHTSPHVATGQLQPTENASVPYFATAHTHLSASPSKSRLAPLTNEVSASQQSTASPLRKAGALRFQDIPEDPPPTNVSGDDSLNLNALMGEVFTERDTEFLKVVSSPQSRHVTRPSASRRSAARSAAPSQKIDNDAEPEIQVESNALTTEEDQRTSKSPAESQGNKVGEGTNNYTPSHMEADTHSKKVQVPHLRERSESSNKTRPPPILGDGEDSQMLNPTGSLSQHEVEAADVSASPGTPASVRKREEAGARAVSQMLASRTTAKTRPAKLSGTGRKKAASRRSHCKETATTENADLSESGGATGDSPQPFHDQVVRSAEDEQSDFALPVRAPHRIFALFKGNYNAYYPGTWLSTTADGKSYQVRFDDGAVSTIRASESRALDLRRGDILKVNIQDMRTKNWIVADFGPVVENGKQANAVDKHGRVVVKVRLKKSERRSLPDKSPQGEGELVDVLIESTYVTQSLWPQYKERVFVPVRSINNARNRVGTPPIGAVNLVDAETPGHQRASRSTSTSRDEIFASGGLFAGMAFAISYLSDATGKEDMTRQIQRNGGMILEQGFDQLFITPQIEETTDADIGLKLKPQYETLGFVALVANRHSRQAKYIQALALGIPTLSSRWVTDSLEPSQDGKLTPRPLPWSKYLLPAGESAYLAGAVRSRTLSPYEPATARFAETIAARDILLEGHHVLLVASKKGKSSFSSERRRPFTFLTLALGVSSVKSVADLQEAKAVVKAEAKWKWVYVDDSVEEAAPLLFGKAASGAGSKKRKKVERSVDGKGEKMVVKSVDGKVGVVGNEFVVQSLILGALVE